MSFLEIVSTILIEPLILAFEIIYVIANRVIGNPGLSIIVLSLVMNFLILPLYMRADAMQEEEKELEQRLHKGVAHIKKTFKGDERMMMLQTFYRQNNYKPTYVLRGAVSLFLEIPFFIAAYRFLSELQLLQGVGFGPIADLGKPDALLTIGGVAINILPIIMTAVNLVSCMIFTKGSSAKQKIQLYGMALFFLVFLYTSPSGLVFYWTLNNVFSLVKTVFYKLKNPLRILGVMFSATGITLAIGGLGFYPELTTRKALFFVGCAALMQFPLVYSLLKDKISIDKFRVKEENANRRIFLTGSMFLTVLLGALIPTAVIKSAPQEFVDINYFYHPLWFVVSSCCLAFGIFVVWMSVFYWLAKSSVKVIFDKIVWIIAGIAVVDYMFFGKDLGLLNAQLQYEKGIVFSKKVMLLNLILLFVLVIILWIMASKWKKRVAEILMIGTLAMAGMSVFNVVNIKDSIKDIQVQAKEGKENTPHFTLSKNGKNVVVLMLDRAAGQYVPYIFNEKPELKEQFEGFTYYANTISYGGFTNFTAPTIFGGYEYTPTAMNKRDDMLLVDKHNEAMKMMPVLFDENGYDVTVCDPTYANYQWIPDLSIYDKYPDIQTYITKGKFSDNYGKKQIVENNKRNFFCYSVVKSVPLYVQEVLYNDGDYNQGNKTIGDNEGTIYAGQKVIDTCTAEGYNPLFMEAYNVLTNMSAMTEIKEGSEDTFLMMTNDTSHESTLLQTPDYTPAENVNNTEYDTTNKDRFTLGGRTLSMDESWQMSYYHCNVAALLRVGEWFDYLKENDVYDNTRIILVADHGSQAFNTEELYMEDGLDASTFYPLLMVKDFDSKEFSTSEKFMTNGDVPTLATDNLIENPVNPFTGNEINSNAKEGEQLIIFSEDYHVNINNGYTYMPGKWYSVHDDMRDKNNWKLEADDAVLTGEE